MQEVIEIFVKKPLKLQKIRMFFSEINEICVKKQGTKNQISTRFSNKSKKEREVKEDVTSPASRSVFNFFGYFFCFLPDFTLFCFVLLYFWAYEHHSQIFTSPSPQCQNIPIERFTYSAANR
jgi:hypothetical protein